MIRKWVESPFLFLGIFFFYFIGIWGLSIPLTGDQKVYLSIALEMKERGEWIIPYLFEAANFLKPPLQYWATLLGWKLFGFSVLGALMPSLFALLLSSFFVKKIFEHFYKANGNLAALLFASSLGTMTYGTTAQMEIWVVCFYLAAWFLALKDKLFICMAVVGAMAWIKGPLYSVLWVLSYSGWNFFLKAPFIKKFTLPLVAGIGIALLWYVLAAQTHYQEIMAIFFKQENLSKMSGNGGSVVSLWGEFIYTLFPWLLLLLSPQLNVKNFKSEIRTPAGAFLFFYFTFPALFFSFFPYKVNTYLYILTPVFSIFLARNYGAQTCVQMSAQTSLLMNGSMKRNVLAVLSTVFSVGMLVLVTRLFQNQWMSIWIFFPLVFILPLWSFAHWKKDIFAVALLSLCLVNLIRIAAVELGEGDIADLRTYAEKNNSQAIAYYIKDKDIWHEFGMVSSAIEKPIAKVYSEQDAIRFLESSGVLILTDLQSESLLHLSKHALLECEDWTRLKKRLRFPIKELILNGINKKDPLLQRVYKICKIKR